MLTDRGQYFLFDLRRLTLAIELPIRKRRSGPRVSPDHLGRFGVSLANNSDARVIETIRRSNHAHLSGKRPVMLEPADPFEVVILALASVVVALTMPGPSLAAVASAALNRGRFMALQVAVRAAA